MNVDPKRPFNRYSASLDTRLMVLVVGGQPASIVELKALLSSVHDIELETALTADRVSMALQKGVRPHVLLVDLKPDNPDDLAVLPALRKISGLEHVPIIALVDRAAAHGPLSAIRAGANDVLLKPLEIGEAREVFGRVLDRSPTNGVKASTLGKALVFMHLSGGVGATTLAVNSAFALTRAQNAKKTCLVDLDIQFGNSASQLDLMSASPVQEFIDDPTRLDESMLESMMQRHSAGLRVLTPPRELLPLNSYSAEGIRHLVELAKRQFGFTVLDLPVALAPWTEAVLKEAAVIYLVTSTSVPSAHRVMKFLDLLQEEGVRDLPLRIVVNRHQRSSRHTNDISLSQFEKALKRKVDFAIPNDYSLISLSHGQGRPAVGLKPKSPFSTALTEMLATDFGNDAVSLTKRSFFSFGRT